MGKKQQRYSKLHKKQGEEEKMKFKQMMKQLSNFKQQNKAITGELKSIVSINQRKKNIRKQQKNQKHKAKNQNSIEQQIFIEEPIKKQINIFEVDSFNSGIKTIVNNFHDPKLDKQKEDLESMAKKLLNGDLNLQNFGQKPLKLIEQKVQIEEEQQKLPSQLPHPNIPIPQGHKNYERKPEISQFRKKLPIYMRQQEIIDMVNLNLVVLICGETGSGKSTQVPQFLLEKSYASFGKIAVTQPRRLAAVALANRVADQMGSTVGELVGYQVRHDRKDSENSELRFVTDGILLNEMSTDPLLTTYSTVILDEAHQRKINTDVLIGLLSRLILIRYKLSLEEKCKPLRLIIMSATLRISDFQNKRLFDFEVPIIRIEARLFPVTVYFEKNTPTDYKKAVVQKCRQIHKKLPPGDVLVFLTGKQQIKQAAIQLEQELSKDFSSDMFSESDQQEIQHKEIEENKNPQMGFIIHCLYSSLPMHEQKKIFKKTPNNCRKFVLSTNIAETSLTIPDIRYVVDSGFEKHRYFEGVWKWKKGWQTRSMAEQRSGRAGRIAPGYCYRLFSAALFSNIMQEYPLPQISKQPLESVILQIKSMGISNIFGFPFPTVPQNSKMTQSVYELIELGALNGICSHQDESTKITELGRVLSFIPLSPKLGKLLLLGRKLNVAKWCGIMSILLTAEPIFSEGLGFKDTNDFQGQAENLKSAFIGQIKKKTENFKNKYKQFATDEQLGEIFTAVNITGHFFTKLFSKSDKTNIFTKIRKFSQQLSLNENVMRQIYLNADQIAEIYETLTSEKMDLDNYSPPNKQQLRAMLDILLESFIGNVCRLQTKNEYKNRRGQKVFIHHLSDRYMKKELFMCCSQFFTNELGRRYMRYSFPVYNYEQLAEHGATKQPKQFAWKKNAIVGLTTGVIYEWQIPNLLIVNPPQEMKYYFIARFFLQGKILEPLKTLNKYLNDSLNVIKPTNIDSKVQKLVSCIKNYQLDNKENFIKMIKNDKNFLKEQLKLWVNMKNFEEVFVSIRKTIIEFAK